MKSKLQAIIKHKYKLTAVIAALIILIIGSQYEGFNSSQTDGNKKAKNITQKAKPVVRPVKVIEISSFDGESSLSYPGIIRSSKQVTLSFKNVGGRLIRFPAENMEGHLIKAGSLVAQLEKKDFLVSLKKIEAQKRKARAGYELNQTEYRREQRIYFADQGATSQSAIVNLKKQMEMAKADMDALKASEEEVQIQLDETEIIAPFSGMIAKTFVHNFQVVQPMQQIASLQDINNLEVLVDLPETFIQKIKQLKRGQIFGEAEFKNLNQAQRYPLRFKEYQIEADKNTQTFQVVLSLKQPGEIRVLPGMTTQIHFKGETKKARYYLLPAFSVISGNNDDFYVYLFDKDTNMAKKTQVKLAEFRNNGKVEVIEGIQAGDTIISTGVSKLRDGMKLRIWNSDDLN